MTYKRYAENDVQTLLKKEPETLLSKNDPQTLLKND